MNEKMESLINNLINGNLSTAKEQAKSFEGLEIEADLMEHAGFSPAKARLGAQWLKGWNVWQQYCDAE